MDNEQATAGLQRQAWLDLKAHVCRALDNPNTDAESLRGVLLTLRRAGVDLDVDEAQPPPQRLVRLA